MKASYIKNALLKSINFMQRNRSGFVRHPNRDFSRKRKCSFDSLFLLLLTMEANSLNHELRRFFSKDGACVMSKSALVQQRAKLNDEAFPFLFDRLNKLFPFRKLYNGYHLLVCDGSAINIPPLEGDGDTRIDSNTEGVSYHQIHLNAIYDILEERYLDILPQKRALLNERDALLEFVRRNPLAGKSLYIADRGYFSLNVLAYLIMSSSSFLLRINSSEIHSSFINRFDLPDADEFDTDLDFYVVRSNKKKYRDHPGKYVYIKKDQAFDFIPEGDTTTLYPISVRLVRILLPDGGVEYLLTDLSRDEFDIAELRKLYNLRWGIETSFRFLKYNVALNSFHSVRRDFIIQELYARVILFNLTMLLAHTVNPPVRKRKYNYKISVSDAVITCRQFIIQKIKNAEIEACLLRYLTEIRPGRSFPRKKRSKRFVSLTNRA